MSREIHQCEYCGEELGYSVKKWPGELVTCGKPECLRYERDCYQEEREEAHRQLDRDLGYY